MVCLVLKERIRKHLLNASRQRRSSDDDEDTLGLVGDIDAVSMHLLSLLSCSLTFTRSRATCSDCKSIFSEHFKYQTMVAEGWINT